MWGQTVSKRREAHCVREDKRSDQSSDSADSPRLTAETGETEKTNKQYAEVNTMMSDSCSSLCANEHGHRFYLFGQESEEVMEKK